MFGGQRVVGWKQNSALAISPWTEATWRRQRFLPASLLLPVSRFARVCSVLNTFAIIRRAKCLCSGCAASRRRKTQFSKPVTQKCFITYASFSSVTAYGFAGSPLFPAWSIELDGFVHERRWLPSSSCTFARCRVTVSCDLPDFVPSIVLAVFTSYSDARRRENKCLAIQDHERREVRVDKRICFLLLWDVLCT